MKAFFRLFSLFVAVVMMLGSFSSCNFGRKDEDEQTFDDANKAFIQNTTPFFNPVASHDTADPFMTYDEETGYYYALFTLGGRLEIYRSRHAGQIISDGDSKVIYTPCDEDSIYGSIWAPEMHKGSDGKWYIYTSGETSTENGIKHLFVLQAEDDDPFGDWKFMNILMPDLFCIDPTIYTGSDGTQYICYSRVDPEYGQVLEMCEMINPYTCSNERVVIARAELDWELVPPYINTDESKRAIVEGAFFLEREGRLFIIYSANGCWSDYYALGVLEHLGGSICDADNWVKHQEPLLTMGNGVYGPGHASFFESPDGSEVWCVYHGMKNSNDSETPADRYMNLQRVEFDSTGYPIIGQPIGYETPIMPPSGEGIKKPYN